MVMVHQGMRRRLVAGIAVIPLLGAAACGGGAEGDEVPDGSDKAPTSAALSPADAAAEVTRILGPIPALTGETVRGINGKVITIGGTGTNTKAGQNTLPGLDVGAKARIERANREGGVNGYTFDYVGFQDDNALPAPSQQATRDLVSSKKVFALVPYAPATGVSKDFLVKENVPAFGFLGQDYCDWEDNPWMFSIRGRTSCAEILEGKSVGNSAPIEQYLAATGKDPKDVKFAVISTSDPYGKGGVKSYKAIAEGLGMEVVYAEAELPSATEPPLSDFTPIATSLANSGADLIVSNVTAPATLGLMGALKALESDADLLFGMAIPALVADKQTAQIVDGMYGATEMGASAFGADTLQTVADDLKEIGSDAAPDGYGTLTTYWAADLFLAAFEKIEGEPTAEKLANVLNGGDFTYKGIEGVTCGQQWPVGRVLNAACAGLVRYDGKGQKLEGLEPLAAVGGYFINDAN